MKTTKVAVCPDCDEQIDFSQVAPKLGQKFACPHCEASLQVINVNPLQVDWDDSEFFDDDFDSNDNWD